MVTRDIYISRVLSLDPLKFVLACETSGGPATRVRWEKNGYRIGRNGELQQNITNYEQATYINKNTISGYIIAGEYTFYSSNNATDHVSSTFDASGKY